MPARPRGPEGWAKFYRVVRRIPSGRVSTYGRVAEIAGWPRAARHVGYAMAALRNTDHDVPWHRVLGARTRAHAAIAILETTGAALQRLRLEAEGVRFDARGRVSFDEFGWTPRTRKR
jgi:methylated-DNA-protein-cysteine methyltransferase-like protein